MSESDRIIMLPALQRSLENQVYEYIEDKKYQEALAISNELIDHEVYDININLAKLSCLTKLNRLDDARIFIEALLQKEDKHYFTYFEIYIGILYETNQYKEIMELIDETAIPKESKEKFNELYRIAFQTNEKMKLASAKELLADLEEAINAKDNSKQWNIINHLRKLNIKPPDEIIRLLKLEIIHPVVKTTIFNWLFEVEYQKDIEIIKFNKSLILNPSESEGITAHLFVIKTMFYLTKIEAENPTLFQMIEEMLIKYIYVNFPILPNESEAENIAIALEALCKQSLYGEIDIDINKKIEKYMNEIAYCYKVYFEVIES